MNLIDTTELMVPGDIFEMSFNDWHRIIYPPMWPMVILGGGKKISCKVLRMFLRSSREVRYVCVSTEDKWQNEFILGQFLEDAYQVSAHHPSLQVSASVIVEAAARIGVRSISAEKPTLYAKEDAEKLAKAIREIPLKERYGYLIPDLVEC